MSIKRILWYSNAPWGKSAYAGQTKLAVRHLMKLGYELAVACNYGLQGATIGSEDGVTLYPMGYDKRSNDIVQSHAEDFNADVIISLFDAWPLRFAKLKTPWIPWLPVDHDPAPRIVVNALQGHPDDKRPGQPALASVAYSRHGLRALQAAGAPDPRYIPLGVETEVYKRQDQREVRERLGLPLDKFIVGQVGANLYFPNRKCIPQTLQAFAQFRQTHPDSLFYLHTEESGIYEGIKLKPLLKALGLNDGSVMLCDQYQYAVGFPETYMRDIFAALDVLLSPSMAEGFGVPIVEAQACGTPVIATDWTSMTELVSGGWVITEYEKWWTQQESWQVIPHVSAIVEALNDAYTAQHWNGGSEWEARRARARARAELYDWGGVVAPMWDALLDELGRDLDAQAATQSRLASLGTLKVKIEPAVSVITPWRDHPELIPAYEAAVEGAQVIVVDSGSAPENSELLADMVRRLGNGSKHICSQRPLGFAEANNHGLAFAAGDIVLFLNNDIEAAPGFIAQVSADVLGGTLYGPSNPDAFVDGLLVPYIEGWCIAARRHVWDALEGWDEAFEGRYWEDVDLCHRASLAGYALERTGWQVRHLSNTTSRDTAGAYDHVDHNRALVVERVRAARAALAGVA